MTFIAFKSVFTNKSQINVFNTILFPVFATQFTKLKSTQPKSCFMGFFPIFSILRSYKKDDFVGDLISGWYLQLKLLILFLINLFD